MIPPTSQMGKLRKTAAKSPSRAVAKPGSEPRSQSLAPLMRPGLCGSLGESHHTLSAHILPWLPRGGLPSCPSHTALRLDAR